jgi:hypothetical protein
MYRMQTAIAIELLQVLREWNVTKDVCSIDRNSATQNLS